MVSKSISGIDIFNNLNTDTLCNILFVNKIFNEEVYKYRDQIKKYSINKNYLCLICENKVLRNAIIIICSCMDNYSTIHQNCLHKKQVYGTKIKCDSCNKIRSFILTNKQL